MKRLIVCFLLFGLIGCSGGGGGNNDTGTAPRITNVELYRIVDGNEIPTTAFNVGDWTSFKLWSYDPDKDVSKIIIEYYYPINAETPYYDEPVTVLIPSQPEAEVIVYPNEPLYIDGDGPAGQWRVEFYLVDNQGHESNIWVIYVSVSEI